MLTTTIIHNSCIIKQYSRGSRCKYREKSDRLMQKISDIVIDNLRKVVHLNAE
jgi:hypothetical protein